MSKTAAQQQLGRQSGFANVRWAQLNCCHLLDRGDYLDFGQDVSSWETFRYEFWSYFNLFFVLLHFYLVTSYSFISFKDISSGFGSISDNQANISTITLLYWSKHSAFSTQIHLCPFFYINSTINAVNWIRSKTFSLSLHFP